MLVNWRARTAWSNRSAEFGRLDLYHGEPAIRLAQEGPDFDQLYRVWLTLSGQPIVLQPIREGWFRYPAIDWAYRVINRASLGVELARAYQMLLALVPFDKLGWFTRPIIHHDLDGNLRLGFVAPVTADAGARCSERGLVHAIGNVLDRDVSGHANLTTLLEAFVAEGGQRTRPIKTRTFRLSSQLVETGLGYLELDRPVEALPHLKAAYDRHFIERPTARRDDQRTRALRDCVETVRELVHFATTKTWAEAKPLGNQLEAEGRWRDAWLLYRNVRDGDDAGPAYTAARARCALAIGENLAALELGRAAGQAAIAAEAACRLKRYDDAIELTAGPTDDQTLLVRGKALAANGRFVEARDVLARTPGIVALMLRRELDRKLITTRGETGTANAQTSPVPDDVRGLILAGKLDDAIEILQRGGDRLILGELYLQTGRAIDALATFEAIDAIEAIDGRARALRVLGRIAEADAARERYEQSAARKSDLRAR